MKKIYRILGLVSICLCFLFISACSCNKDNPPKKVSLSVGDMNATTYKQVSLEEVDTMVEGDETFLLYIYDRYCTTCNGFKPKLESIIEEKNLIVYGLEAVEITDTHALKSIKVGPSIALYENGEIVYKTSYEKNPELFDTKEGFENFLNEYTNLPTMYYITLDQLASKITNDESFIVYYSRNTCPDCTHLSKNFLKNFLQNNPSTKHFYVLETNVEGIRLTDGQTNSAQWQAFKDQYGLSNANNPIGHGVGYVPTIQYYEDGEIKDMFVYFNDYEANQTYTEFTITEEMSYYDDNPYIGQTIPASEYKSKVVPFYEAKLQAFLDANLSKVD